MIHSNNDTHKKLFYSTLKHEPCMGTMQDSPWNLSQEGKIHEKGLKCRSIYVLLWKQSHVRRVHTGYTMHFDYQ